MSNILLSEITRTRNVDGRFQNVECLSFNPLTGEREGVLSFAFKAKDVITDRNVVIKFFDPSRGADAYRTFCYEREVENLKKVVGKFRCLQLVQDRKQLTVNLNVGSGNLTFLFPYFVTELLPIRIIEDFYKNKGRKIIDKIEIFKLILLGVMQLHKNDIVHRDLKPDNVMGCMENRELVVKAIDLGSSTHLDSYNASALLPHSTPGARGYSSPENDLKIDIEAGYEKQTDVFALGCMFYELFHPDPFYAYLDGINYYDCLDYFKQLLQGKSNSDQKNIWTNFTTTMESRQIIPPFDKGVTGIPLSILSYVNNIFYALIDFDYKKRVRNLNEILSKLDLCLRILRYDEKIAKKRELKSRK